MLEVWPYSAGDLDLTDSNGDPPMYDALNMGNEIAARLLIEHGASTVIRNNRCVSRFKVISSRYRTFIFLDSSS